MDPMIIIIAIGILLSLILAVIIIRGECQIHKLEKAGFGINDLEARIREDLARHGITEEKEENNDKNKNINNK